MVLSSPSDKPFCMSVVREKPSLVDQYINTDQSHRKHGQISSRSLTIVESCCQTIEYLAISLDPMPAIPVSWDPSRTLKNKKNKRAEHEQAVRTVALPETASIVIK